MPASAWIFDTGSLQHFAIQGWLGVLRYLAGDHPIFIPESVERELNQAADVHSAVRTVLRAEWITVYRSADLAYSAAFARYADRLVADGKNLGECGVLAMGDLFGGKVVVDDATARTIAEEMGIDVMPTVYLLCTASARDR